MPAELLLLRHGQSVANANGTFTGALDVELTVLGRAEAHSAAQLMSEAGLLPGSVISSTMRRAVETAQIVRGELSSEIALVTDWRLNERSYGSLTGRSKAEVLTEFGEEQFRLWRRSVDVAPPPLSEEQLAPLRLDTPHVAATESLRDVMVRVSECYRDTILPAALTGSRVLVVAHGNSLRALCAHLDDLSDHEVSELNIPTGQPLLYRVASDGRAVVRGGRFLDPLAASAAAAAIAREGG
ncbi:MAG: 2,3-bisphosphoglycerate-dependent phosphoglycerate mutase, partial [Lacisediminihabitans sp.]